MSLLIMLTIVFKYQLFIYLYKFKSYDDYNEKGGSFIAFA